MDWGLLRNSFLWTDPNSVKFALMTKSAKILCLLIMLGVAVGSNLLLTEWGADRQGVPILTVQYGSTTASNSALVHGFGLYSRVSLNETPWIAMSFGLLLPLACVAAMTYFLVRLNSGSSGS